MITMEKNGSLPKKYKGEYEHKRIFVNELKSPLMLANFDVLDIEYIHPKEHREYVKIKYCSGHEDLINVACNSCNAIAVEILRQLTGEGAFGLCKRLSR